MLNRFATSVCIFLILSGCATTELQVSYDSVPRGASIIQNGQIIGTTPTTIYYQVTPDNRKNEEMYLLPLTFRWVSGAEYTKDRNHVMLPRSLTSDNPVLYVTETVNRPEQYPGLDKDQQFALEVERINLEAAHRQMLQNQIAEENLKRGVGEFFDELNEKREQIYKDALRSPTSTRCRSKESYGGSIITDCETY